MHECARRGGFPGSRGKKVTSSLRGSPNGGIPDFTHGRTGPSGCGGATIVAAWNRAPPYRGAARSARRLLATIVVLELAGRRPLRSGGRPAPRFDLDQEDSSNRSIKQN